MNIIETKGLTKDFGSVLGVDDLNLTVKKGEILGFIGPNGAGKSTTIRLLLSLIYPTSGSATIFGKDVVTQGPEIKKDIGYLPSEVFYYENMRAKDLLEYSASFYKKDCSKRINEIADLLKLDLTKKIDDLSYGNKKKVGIVQGLLHSPKLLILDEPTGGLDPLIQKNFFELLQRENENGVTIFFSSHILGEVQKICDRVAIIKEGKLVNIESMSNITENSYKKIDLKSKSPLPKDLSEIAGITNFKKTKREAEFLYKGNVNEVVKVISKLDLEDVTISEPDLEEIFMHYYN